MRSPVAWSSRPSSAWLQRLPGRRRRIRRLLEAAARELTAGARICDVGGGTGYPLELLASGPRPDACAWILADPQRGMLERAAAHLDLERSDAPLLVQADGVALPFRDGSADLVLSLGVLCCTAPEVLPQSVREILRVLRPGGRLAFAVPRRHAATIEALLCSAGFAVVERFGSNRVLLRKGINHSSA